MTEGKAPGSGLWGECAACGSEEMFRNLHRTPRGTLCIDCTVEFNSAVASLAHYARVLRAELVNDIENRRDIEGTMLRSVKRDLAREITDALHIVQGDISDNDAAQEAGKR